MDYFGHFSNSSYNIRNIIAIADIIIAAIDIPVMPHCTTS